MSKRIGDPRYCPKCGLLFNQVADAMKHHLEKHPGEPIIVEPEPVVVPNPTPPSESSWRVDHGRPDAFVAMMESKWTIECRREM